MKVSFLFIKKKTSSVSYVCASTYPLAKSYSWKFLAWKLPVSKNQWTNIYMDILCYMATKMIPKCQTSLWPSMPLRAQALYWSQSVALCGSSLASSVLIIRKVLCAQVASRSPPYLRCLKFCCFFFAKFRKTYFLCLFDALAR